MNKAVFIVAALILFLIAILIGASFDIGDRVTNQCTKDQIIVAVNDVWTCQDVEDTYLTNSTLIYEDYNATLIITK